MLWQRCITSGARNYFEAGVVKIEKGIENQMNDSEKAVVRILKSQSIQVAPAALEAPLRVTTSVNDWQRGGNGVKKRAVILIGTLSWAPLPRWREFLALQSMFYVKKAFHDTPNFVAMMFLKLKSTFLGCSISRRSHKRSSNKKSIGVITWPAKFEMMRNVIMKKRSSSYFSMGTL